MSSVVFVCSQRGSLCNRSHRTRLGPGLPTTWAPSQDLFKLVHYVALISIGKQAVGLRLNSFLFLVFLKTYLKVFIPFCFQFLPFLLFVFFFCLSFPFKKKRRVRNKKTFELSTYNNKYYSFSLHSTN